MSRTTLGLSADLQDYVVAHSSARDPVLLDLSAETAAMGAVAECQIAPEQGVFLTLLTRAMGARRAVEVGTFTGYSSICIARGLPPDGELICCDISEEWTAVARRHWERAGIADRIDLRVAPALETLRALPEGGWIDLAFLDADKIGYPAYWAELVRRLRPGGVLLVDNVLAGGTVVDPDTNDERVAVIREFNERAMRDDRVEVVILPIADGLTMAVRNP